MSQGGMMGSVGPSVGPPPPFPNPMTTHEKALDRKRGEEALTDSPDGAADLEVLVVVQRALLQQLAHCRVLGVWVGVG